MPSPALTRDRPYSEMAAHMAMSSWWMARAAWPMAPESLVASSTVWRRTLCFCTSVRFLNSVPNISAALALRVYSVDEMPRAASLA